MTSGKYLAIYTDSSGINGRIGASAVRNVLALDL